MHDPWDKLLQTYVKDGKVSYSDWKKNSEDIKALDNYIAALGTASIADYTRKEKLAFWINAYNSFTIKLIFNHFPVKSIRDIKNPWKQQVWTAAGEKLSLDDIEHKKLRAELKEPRIHFAIVCASIGCPDLDNRAFKAETVDKHLNSRTQLFFKLKKNFYIEGKKGAVNISVSSILKWFTEDFGKNQKERIAFMLKYLDKGRADIIKGAKEVKIKHIEYDWSLNGN
jgi:hypothetical protein